MMALSLVVHASFFSFILYARPFRGGFSSLRQSYQVTLVAPETSSLPAASSQVALSPPSVPSRKESSPKETPSLQPETVKAPVVQASPVPLVPPPSAATKGRTSKEPAPPKEDPERLQEWWKKKAGSIKISPIEPKPAPAPAPNQEVLKRPINRPEEGKPGESHPSTKQELASGNTPSAETSPQNRPPASQNMSSIGGSESSSVVARGESSLNISLFPFPYYVKSIENKISGGWAPPPGAFEPEVAQAMVQFTVSKKGRIESVEIEKSSGNPQFDLAALRAVKEADPLPPLPEGLLEDPLKIHFSFTVHRGS